MSGEFECRVLRIDCCLHSHANLALHKISSQESPLRTNRRRGDGVLAIESAVEDEAGFVAIRRSAALGERERADGPARDVESSEDRPEGESLVADPHREPVSVFKLHLCRVVRSGKGDRLNNRRVEGELSAEGGRAGDIRRKELAFYGRAVRQQRGRRDGSLRGVFARGGALRRFVGARGEGNGNRED